MDDTLDFLRDRLPQIKELMQDRLRKEMYDAEAFETKPRVLMPALEAPVHQYKHLEEMESNSGSDLQSRMGSFLNNYEMADSSLSGGSGGGYIDAGSNRGFVSPQQAQSMLDNPSAFGGLNDREVMLLREGLNIPGV